jgi:flagellar hook-associated protein 3 FlgL
MRITNSMMIANTVRNMNNAARRLSEAQERMSSQQKIQLASDDPVIATRAVKYRNYVATVEQYQKNVDDVTSWQEVTETALSDLSDVIQQIRELTVKASSDTMTGEDLADIQTQIVELRDEAIQIMNTSYAGRYVFAGYSTGEEPYKLVTTDVGDTVMFKGEYLSLGGVVTADTEDDTIVAFCEANTEYEASGTETIKYNIGFNTDITVNIEGQDVIGQGSTNLFDTLAKLILALDGETSYKTAEVADDGTVTVATNTIDSIDDLLTDLDTDYDRLLTTQATLGARMDSVSRAAERLSTDYTTYTTLMSNNEDVDVSEASTEVASAEYVYEASLSVGAKVITKTLVDYLA